MWTGWRRSRRCSSPAPEQTPELLAQLVGAAEQAVTAPEAGQMEGGGARLMACAILLRQFSLGRHGRCQRLGCHPAMWRPQLVSFASLFGREAAHRDTEADKAADMAIVPLQVELLPSPSFTGPASSLSRKCCPWPSTDGRVLTSLERRMQALLALVESHPHLGDRLHGAVAAAILCLSWACTPAQLAASLQLDSDPNPDLQAADILQVAQLVWESPAAQPCAHIASKVSPP